MKPRICVCCGERIAQEVEHAAPKYDHICDTCAHLFEDMKMEDLIAPPRSSAQPQEKLAIRTDFLKAAV